MKAARLNYRRSAILLLQMSFGLLISKIIHEIREGRKEAKMTYELLIETSSNQIYLVRPTQTAGLDHVWFGRQVKKTKGGWAFKANSREILVRKEASVIRGSDPIPCGDCFLV